MAPRSHLDDLATLWQLALASYAHKERHLAVDSRPGPPTRARRLCTDERNGVGAMQAQEGAGRKPGPAARTCCAAWTAGVCQTGWICSSATRGCGEWQQDVFLQHHKPSTRFRAGSSPPCAKLPAADRPIRLIAVMISPPGCIFQWSELCRLKHPEGRPMRPSTVRQTMVMISRHKRMRKRPCCQRQTSGRCCRQQSAAGAMACGWQLQL